VSAEEPTSRCGAIDGIAVKTNFSEDDSGGDIFLLSSMALTLARWRGAVLGNCNQHKEKVLFSKVGQSGKRRTFIDKLEFPLVAFTFSIGIEAAVTMRLALICTFMVIIRSYSSSR